MLPEAALNVKDFDARGKDEPARRPERLKLLHFSEVHRVPLR
jgi:hypothetical protein